jgi:hypothetical protein
VCVTSSRFVFHGNNRTTALHQFLSYQCHWLDTVHQSHV